MRLCLRTDLGNQELNKSNSCFWVSFVLAGLLLPTTTFSSQAEDRNAAFSLSLLQPAPLVAATHAGSNLVAVGDHGVVMLSADGQAWRQSKHVPVDSLLTAVSFADALNGWAVGHGGTLLHTQDGGDTWSLQATLEDQPVILSVWFENPQHGIVVGAYGYASETRNGGQSWQRLTLSEDNDYHLNQIFPGTDGTLFIAAESGGAYRSKDSGSTWESLDTGASGSLWTGTSLRDGHVLMAGMSGRVLVSNDMGERWQKLDCGTNEAITAVIQLDDARVAMVGNGGLVAVTDNTLSTCVSEIREDRQNLTALASTPAGLVVFTAQGALQQALSLPPGNNQDLRCCQ